MNSSLIDINSWPLTIQLFFLAAPFALSAIGLTVSGCVAWSSEFEVLDSSIRTNAYLEQMKRFLGTTTYRSRWMVVCAVSGLLTFPRFHSRIGVVDADELKAFPTRLRRKLVFSSWLILIGIAWLAVAYVMVSH
ncbi:hypothetical protein HP546_25915 [Pseudomonas sp. CM25]|uniref:hypothetical protein n=1 Tax=Pseudomonas sp. CM25 TaxID=2738448 RepID=UPI00155670CC|nr:hypothetical protein [Pseudomonas sp. CM25]NQD58781.1 hypothetical protein [Pseudomonas sp. CM25]HEN8799943.1 hypothetical protein [Pseudomonas putida]